MVLIEILNEGGKWNAFIGKELLEHLGVGVVVEQVVVVFMGDLVELREAGPGNGGEIVVLIVIAEVAQEKVEGRVHRVGGLATPLEIVLQNKVEELNDKRQTQKQPSNQATKQSKLTSCTCRIPRG